jgi:hypothetical protein
VFSKKTIAFTMPIKRDHPAYPFREEPEGSCKRGGTFAYIIHQRSQNATNGKIRHY